MTSLADLLAQARGSGPRATRAAGRLMTLLENEPGRLPELLQAAGPDAPQPRLLLGLTGAPGSGKSTLTDAILGVYRKQRPEMKIGVIAVDPSSPFSGGAVLGDRVRMMRHATDPYVYVRSLASRGHLGGLALGVKGILRVMGLLGIEVVLIETVGVGQSEIEIVRFADEILVILAPGQGDSVQLLKAGLMEIGNFIVINKADNPGAEELHHQILAAMKLEPEGRQRHVALVSAVEQKHVDELVDAVEAAASGKEAERLARRAASQVQELREALLESARTRLLQAMEQEDHARDIAALGSLAQDFEPLVRRLLADAARP